MTKSVLITLLAVASVASHARAEGVKVLNPMRTSRRGRSGLTASSITWSTIATR